MNEFTSIYDEVYQPANEAEKLELIDKLHSGDYKLSFSSLSAFAVSPMAFVNYKVGERKETPAMLLGNVLHCLLLEEEAFKDRYLIGPENAPLNTAAGKNEWAAFAMDVAGASFETNKQGNYNIPAKGELFKLIEGATGKKVVDRSTVDEARFRARSVVSNRACRYVLNKIEQTEVALPDDFEVDGIRFTGRIDGKGSRVIADLKNMPDATMAKAVSTVWSRRLHWQAWAYDESFGGGNKCYVLAVDGSGETSAICFHENNLSSAKRQVRQYVQKFKAAVLESMLISPTVWDRSQDFWCATDMNPEGIIYL